MSTILDTIADYARLRVAQDAQSHSLDDLKALCRQAGPGNGTAFERALAKNGMSFIFEVKKASPSKGIIAENFPYLDIALAYADAGADCISCLTEPKWFLGSDEIFSRIRAAVSTPMIRKDFTIDEYQLYQARLMGADCVLLICALLDTETIQRYLTICESLGLAALVEAHDEEEVARALKAGAKIVGVNNRDLKTFKVDMNNSIRLRNLAPYNVVFVSESGIKNAGDIAILERNRVGAVLIGETLMRSPDKKAALEELNGGALR